MNATQRKRLLKLADFIVEKVPKRSFHMCRYGGMDLRPLTTVPNGGPAGCPLGWCTVLFKKLGVAFEGGSPKYKDRTGYGVGVSLFGLNYDQSVTLFTAEKAGRSAKQVRRDILRTVARLDKTKQPMYVSVGKGGDSLKAKAKRNGWNLFSNSGGVMRAGWFGDSTYRTYYIKKISR